MLIGETAQEWAFQRIGQAFRRRCEEAAAKHQGISPQNSYLLWICDARHCHGHTDLVTCENRQKYYYKFITTISCIRLGLMLILKRTTVTEDSK